MSTLNYMTQVGIKATDLDLLSTEAMKVGQMNVLTSSNVIHEINQIQIFNSNFCLKPAQLFKLHEQIQFTNIYEMIIKEQVLVVTFWKILISKFVRNSRLVADIIK